MKKFIVNALFWLGDFVSKRNFLFKHGFGYNLYNWLMVKSMNLQDKWKLDETWKKVND